MWIDSFRGWHRSLTIKGVLSSGLMLVQAFPFWNSLKKYLNSLPHRKQLNIEKHEGIRFEHLHTIWTPLCFSKLYGSFSSADRGLFVIRWWMWEPYHEPLMLRRGSKGPTSAQGRLLLMNGVWNVLWIKNSKIVCHFLFSEIILVNIKARNIYSDTNQTFQPPKGNQIGCFFLLCSQCLLCYWQHRQNTPCVISATGMSQQWLIA